MGYTAGTFDKDGLFISVGTYDWKHYTIKIADGNGAIELNKAQALALIEELTQAMKLMDELNKEKP